MRNKLIILGFLLVSTFLYAGYDTMSIKIREEADKIGKDLGLPGLILITTFAYKACEVNEYDCKFCVEFKEKMEKWLKKKPSNKAELENLIKVG